MARINKTRSAEFDAFVENIMSAYNAKGVAVSIFGLEDTYYEKYYGYRDEQNKLEINEDTIFGMASISKSFASLSIMQLVEKGKLDLDELVSAYIPEFSGKTQKNVKLRHLLSHSAGFYPEKRILAQDMAKELGISYSEKEDIAYNEALALAGVKQVARRLDNSEKYIGRPGEYMSYSNDSYGLISDIIRSRGEESSYASYVNKNIFKPLGMTRSSLEFEAPAKDNNCTMLYSHRNGKLNACRDFYDNAFVLMGGGAIKSTVSDLKSYTRMYLRQGKTKDGGVILSPYSIREMAKPRQLYRFQTYYGFGLSTKFMNDFTVIGHGGSLTGVSNMFLWSPELECAVIVFCNTSDVPASVLAEGAMRFARDKSPYAPDIFTYKSWDEKTITNACGFYKSGEGGEYEIIYDNGTLELKLNGVPIPTCMAEKNMLIVEKPYNKTDVLLMVDDSAKPWGIRVGGRIIPKECPNNNY